MIGASKGVGRESRRNDGKKEMWGSCLFHLLIFHYTLLSSVFSHPCTVSNSVNVMEPREVVIMAPREVVMEPREIVMEPRHAAAVILKHHPAHATRAPQSEPPAATRASGG